MAKSKSKHNKRPSHTPQPRPPLSAPGPRQEGLRAFRAGRFDEAIAAWSPLTQHDTTAAAALAETYFRRALAHTTTRDQQADLRQAIALAPADLRFRYHLGLALHRAGDLAAAIEHYRAILQHDSAWPGVRTVLAIALLEQNPRADVASLFPDASSAWAPMAAAQALLRGDVPAPSDDGPLDRLWRGLGLLRRDGAAARDLLADTRPLPTAPLTALRRYYAGVAVAQCGDMDAAVQDWQQAAAGRFVRPWLWTNLAAAMTRERDGRLTIGMLGDVVVTLERALQGGGGAAIGDALVHMLDGAARDAAATGDWTAATQLWEKARQIVATASGLGTPRPLLHNLALAYEAQERWMDAAEAWRAMLRTQPRKARRSAETPTVAATGEMADSQWSWVRRRVIECYQHAGAPGEAVTLFRQAVKANPADLDTRLQLADALLVNQQEQAAANELERILQIDPQHVDAQIRLARVQHDRGYWYNAVALLRDVLKRQPERADARRQLALLLLEQGRGAHYAGHYARATTMLEEGWELAPGDAEFPLSLARIAIDQGKPARVAPLLERALELAEGRASVYTGAVECWLAASDEDAARAVVARAEKEVPSTLDFYLDLVALLLAHDTAPGLGLRARPSRRAGTVWSSLAEEILERAAMLGPDDAGVRRQIVEMLLTLRPDLALRYAEEAVQLAPDDADGLLQLGLALGYNDRRDEARQTVRRAARLARQQGRLDVAQRAEALAHRVGSPMFRFSLEMARMFDTLGIDPGELPL